MPEGAESALRTGPATTVALTHAEAKASLVASGHAGTRTVVLAADTLISLDGIVIGKPANKQGAIETLRLLQGKTHSALTAYAVVDCSSGRHSTGVAEARVTMRHLSAGDITAYVASGEPLDKAGAYGIQGKGALLVERVDGDYYAIVGLPLCQVAITLVEFGISLL